MVLANLIGGFIVILVGVNLMPILADSVYGARFEHNGSGWQANNVTGASAVLISLSTLFFAIGIISAGIALVVSGFKNAGIM